MDMRLSLIEPITPANITITGSKSETNRLLILQSLYPGIKLYNTSNSDDSQVMQKALSGNENVIDVHHAGTAMRFLTAFFAVQEGRELVLTGSGRMKERPIGILVNALQELGAKIEYLDTEGFPPLKITGQRIVKSKVTLQADVSSQYITALLLIAPKLENGLEIILQGNITSRPYILMTLSLLNVVGISATFVDNCIKVLPQANIAPVNITVESDWSSASYFYSIIALSGIGTKLTLSAYRQNSMQGDSVLTEIYKSLRVATKFSDNTITLQKVNTKLRMLDLNLIDAPDIAQTIAITCFGLGVGCNLSGLHTLKIKETDRLEALKTELQKMGAAVTVTQNSLHLSPGSRFKGNSQNIETYNDHRMAMAFAPLAVIAPVTIQNAEVVSKSYPAFWNDLEWIGFTVKELL